ncbi:glycine--tRNA ligase [Candidatus Nomurabacteria bacterium]|nr:glycine--tRNA ligase [Candidatus Saccharibacteria bacterium]MCB9839586.1 glycine--tRNA ligase [Candidatus Nomurabacteria bacterium]
MEDIVSLAKRRGFIFQGSEVYGGLAGTWDYGPYGLMLKKNILNLWWQMFVTDREDIFGVDAAILMNPRVWQASGHVDTFTDPLVECSNCKGRFRADKIDTSKCPTCGESGTFSEPKQFNMMFKTNVGPVADESSVSYLRPETAQGIFTNYKNVVDTIYPDLPFGIAQQGKAFRNEISPRDFIFRSREFEQMEIEYFVYPENWQEEFEKWVGLVREWLNQLGLSSGKINELEVPENERAHYSKRTIDFEYDFPSLGKEELLGLAYRTDFDLMNIQNHSGKSMDYIIKGTNQKIVPHVIEPSFGVERTVMAVLSEAYKEDEINGEKRVYLALPDHLAPLKFAVSPLLKNKPELVNKAREVYEALKKKHGNVMWDDNGNIGKRYRRQDEIGTPHCIVIDFETLENDTVTVRDRDTTNQSRLKISELLES